MSNEKVKPKYRPTGEFREPRDGELYMAGELYCVLRKDNDMIDKPHIGKARVIMEEYYEVDASHHGTHAGNVPHKFTPAPQASQPVTASMEALPNFAQVGHDIVEYWTKEDKGQLSAFGRSQLYRTLAQTVSAELEKAFRKGYEAALQATTEVENNGIIEACKHTHWHMDSLGLWPICDDCGEVKE